MRCTYGESGHSDKRPIPESPDSRIHVRSRHGHPAYIHEHEEQCDECGQRRTSGSHEGGVGLLAPFVGREGGYASWCEQVWRGITLTALECIPNEGSVNRTPLPATPVVISFCSHPKASFLLRPKENPTHFVRERGSLAEGVGFEPTIPVKVCRFSRPVRSTRLRHPSSNCTEAAGGKSTPYGAAFQKKTSSNDLSSDCSRPPDRCFTARTGVWERGTPTGRPGGRWSFPGRCSAEVWP